MRKVSGMPLAPDRASGAKPKFTGFGIYLAASSLAQLEVAFWQSMEISSGCCVTLRQPICGIYVVCR